MGGVDLGADEPRTPHHYQTLYDRFGSKEGLTLAYLRRRYETWRDFLARYLDAAPEAGPARVLAVFDAIEAWMHTNPRGCGFINAYATSASTTPSASVAS